MTTKQARMLEALKLLTLATRLLEGVDRSERTSESAGVVVAARQALGAAEVHAARMARGEST